jgi:hypothetical protein
MLQQVLRGGRSLDISGAAGGGVHPHEHLGRAWLRDRL